MQRSQLHLEELGLASLCALFVNANRDPKKGKPAKPSDFYRFELQDGKIPAYACDAFFSLVKDNLMPGWVLAIAPLEEMRNLRKFDSYPRPRVWIGDGVMLICPQFLSDRVIAPLAIVNAAQGIIQLADPDSDQIYNVLIEGQQEECAVYWEQDFEAECDQIEEAD